MEVVGIRKAGCRYVILEDERYLEIFPMVDYGICGMELDIETPNTK